MINQERISKITELSNKLGTHSDKIIEMMQHHTSEIEELYNKKDKHFSIETGDLIILSIQLLIKEGYPIEEIMNNCYDRFDKKLTGLLSNVNRE